MCYSRHKRHRLPRAERANQHARVSTPPPAGDRAELPAAPPERDLDAELSAAIVAAREGNVGPLIDFAEVAHGALRSAAAEEWGRLSKALDLITALGGEIPEELFE